MKMEKTPAKIIIYLLYFLSLGILLTLGGWQITRGLEKKSIEQSVEGAKSHFHELASKPEDWAQLNYKKAKLTGNWVTDKIFKLDNRVYKKRVGHEWFIPFQLINDEAIILVNIGWLPDEEIFLANELSSDEAIVSGDIYKPEKGFTLGPAFTDSDWPRLIQYFDRQSLSDALNKTLEPVVLVIDEDNPYSLTRIWAILVIPSNGGV